MTAIITALGTLAALAAWWGCHWLASCLREDDDKDKGIFR